MGISEQSIYGPGWEPVACGLTPPEVAARCRALGGLAFLDSAMAREGERALSVVAAAPTLIENSHIACGLDARGQAGPGIAIATMEYEGAVRMRWYRQAAVYEHDTRRWWHLGGLLKHLPATPPAGTYDRIEFQPEMSREHYCELVQRALDYIAAGDIYQVNLARRFSAAFQGDAWAFYMSLRACSPKPFAAFIEDTDQKILSASPELFLDIRGQDIVTRPIKGTRPRRAAPEQDAQSARELQGSEKEAAELLMITDLERNDLGRICATGSVSVPELVRLETYEQVFHLVSTVKGTLRDDVSLAQVMDACFPGGSITGAPKIRAMQIIRELEPVPRGIYTGSIGCLGLGTRMVFNIAIRTATVAHGRIQFHAGAGIVADSVPENEYVETLQKAAGLMQAGAAGSHPLSGAQA